MKNIKKTALSIAALGSLIISGCGSSSSSDSSLTGYYLDSAVKGVSYSCGTREGTTDSEGKFRFENGDNCKFTLAGITLKELDTTLLPDGAKVVETTPDVLVFLQSIDKDGDPSTGIDIDSEVLSVLTTALENYTTVPTDDNLTAVVETLKQEVEDFEGDVVTENEALEHLTTTQSEVTKELLAGKTFYLTYSDSYGVVIEKLVFNSDATELVSEVIEGDVGSASTTNSMSVSIDGDTFVTTNTATNDIQTHKILEVTQSYVKLDDSEVPYIYYSYDDVKAAADKLTETESDESIEFSVDYLNGKTFYWLVYNDFGYDTLKYNVAKLTFSESSVVYQEYDTPDSDEHTFDYTVTDGKLSLSNTDISSLYVLEATDSFLRIEDANALEQFFYFDEAQAKSERDRLNGYYTLQESDIAGHSIYVGDPSKDKEYHTDYTFTSLEDNESERDTGTWSIELGKLKHVWSSGSEEIHYFLAKPAIGVTIVNETYDVNGTITNFQ